MVVEFRKPTEEAIEQIASTMREADAVEVMASHGHTPYEALMAGWKSSDYSIICYINGEPSCMFGLVRRDVLSGHGVCWMLASECIMKNRKQLLIHTPAVINEMLILCSRLSNHVHADNTLSIRWLRWLGFTIEDPEPLGVNGEMFHLFHKERIS